MQVQHELAGLLNHRNRLAARMAPPSTTSEPPSAPPMLQESFACERCPMAETCAIHHKVCERAEGLCPYPPPRVGCRPLPFVFSALASPRVS